MKRISVIILFLFLGVPFMDKMVYAQRKFGSKMDRGVLIEEKLKQINKPAVKTIQGEDGDVIDCVDIYKQPAFDHPLLKDHKIQMRPSDELLAKLSSSDSRSEISESQLWQHNDTCPDGTIPILRVQKHHLLNSPSIKNYGRKPAHKDARKYKPSSFNRSNPVESDHLHEQAVLVGAGYSYLGATAEIGVWNPRVEASDEYSSGQIWLRNGPYDRADSIEVGWIVNPALYGDHASRLFIYWTADSGSKTGCFNTLCPGFVQTNSKVVLGARFNQISKPGGPQFRIRPKIQMSQEDRDKWWVVIGDNTIVGYWPTKLFNSLGKAAALAMFGGDVYSPRMKNQPPHTATQMGSGEFANMHWAHAAYVGNPRVLGYSGSWDYPDPGQTTSFHTNCYSAQNYAERRWTEPYFYYGGPGRNPSCP